MSSVSKKHFNMIDHRLKELGLAADCFALQLLLMWAIVWDFGVPKGGCVAYYVYPV